MNKVLLIISFVLISSTDLHAQEDEAQAQAKMMECMQGAMKYMDNYKPTKRYQEEVDKCVKISLGTPDDLTDEEKAKFQKLQARCDEIMTAKYISFDEMMSFQSTCGKAQRMWAEIDRAKSQALREKWMNHFTSGKLNLAYTLGRLAPTFQGEPIKGKIDGCGTYLNPSIVTRYDGCWSDGKKEGTFDFMGQGITAKYTYKNNLLDGPAKILYCESKLKVNFNNPDPSRSNEYLTNSGYAHECGPVGANAKSLFEGNYKNGERIEGKQLWFKKSKKYIKMKAMMPQGGNLVKAYSGEWKNDLFHGKGKLIVNPRAKNEVIFDGTWNQGEWVDGVITDKAKEAAELQARLKAQKEAVIKKEKAEREKREKEYARAAAERAREEEEERLRQQQEAKKREAYQKSQQAAQQKAQQQKAQQQKVSPEINQRSANVAKIDIKQMPKLKIIRGTTELTDVYLYSLSHFLYAQELLLYAYGRSADAQKVRTAIDYASNGKYSETDRIKNSIKVTTESSEVIRSVMDDQRNQLNQQSAYFYSKSLTPAFGGYVGMIKLIPAGKNIVRRAEENPIMAVFELVGVLSIAPSIPGYVSTMANTTSLILTSAKAQDIEGAENLSNKLEDL